MHLAFSKPRGRKMTKLEKKQYADLKKRQKDAQHTQLKVASTLNWCDIDEITDSYVTLLKGKSLLYVQGIKLSPHNIFMDDPQTQARLINSLRLCLNKCPTDLYFCFVQTPVQADEHIAALLEEDRSEKDLVVKAMIRNDFDKIYGFQEDFRELEFFVMIRDTDPKRLEKRYVDLESEFRQSGFLPTMLNKRDYYNFLEYCFENSLINDFYFSRGVFTPLNQKWLYNEGNDTYHISDETEEFLSYGEPIRNTYHQKRVDKSRLVPTSYSIHSDYLTVGDKYVTCGLITELPKTFYLGLLCQYVNLPDVKVYMTTEKLDMNISVLLKKDYQDKLQQLNKSTDPSLRRRLEYDLDSLQEYIDDSIRNNDSTHNVTIVFMIYSDDLKEMVQRRKDLKLQLNAMGFHIDFLKYMQDNLFKLVNPLLIETKLPTTIKENLGVPLPSDGVAGLYPFVFETQKDQHGFLLGYELQNLGMILFNPFLYMEQPDVARITQRFNGNCVVVGMSGAGKTTMMNLIIRDFIKRKIKLIWIDPENKNYALTKRYGGTFILWGQKNNIINIFDLKPLSTEDDEDDASMWDTELAIYNVIEDITQILKYLYPNINEDTLSVVGSVALATYRKVDIYKQDDGSWTPFKDLNYKDMPTFTTFNECLIERIEEIKEDPTQHQELALLMDLKQKMVRILTEWSIYFNGHTSIRVEGERQIISFGTKILFNKSKELREALYHIMFQYAWSLCLNDKETTAFINDEAHVTILEGSTAKLLSQFYRRARKYKTSMIIGTQEPHDLVDSRVITEGKAIFNNSAYTFIMKLGLDACNDVAQLVRLNENERMSIQSFNQGDALFISGNRRIPIHVMATKSELDEMSS